MHHSSPTLDWLATFRVHLLEQTFRRIVAPVFLIMLGFPLPAVALAAAILFVWGMFNHANVKFELRVLEPILITPRLHHVRSRSATA